MCIRLYMCVGVEMVCLLGLDELGRNEMKVYMFLGEIYNIYRDRYNTMGMRY